jgi:signal transduction histidine kinase
MMLALALVGISLLAVAVLVVRVRRLERSRRTLEALVEGCALFTWRADAQGMIVQVSPAGARPEVLGHPFWNPYNSPGDGTMPEDLIRARDAGPRRFELDVHPPAAPRSLRLVVVPLHGAGGAVAGYAGAVLSSTADDTARALEDLESFSYSVSHDLRSPLRIVDGFATILLEDYGPRLDGMFREHVGRIVAAVARMNAMIEALLALSRRTGQDMHWETTDLAAMATELAAELRAAQPGRSLEFRIAPGLSARGDPALLRLVLQNLLGNACKFSANVPRAVVEFGCEAIEGEPAFFVRDNGAGFDMRHAARLFGVFQRLHSQNEFPGTGVGLATVQRIVRRHGGRIWAEAEPGKGACFRFTLPGGADAS